MESLISLRAPEPSDLDLLYLWENDPELWPCGDNPAPMSRHALSEYINNYTGQLSRDGSLRLVIVRMHDGQAVGTLDLFDYDPRNSRAAVGIFIDEHHRNHGYAADALHWLDTYASQHLNLHQLWAVVAVDNDPSRVLFTQAGYKSAGKLRSWLKSGRHYTDALLFQKLFE